MKPRRNPSARQAGRAEPSARLREAGTRALANALVHKLHAAEISDPEGASLGLLAAELDLKVRDHNWNKFGAARDWLRVVEHHPDASEDALVGGGVIEFGAGGMNPLSPLVGLMLRGVTPAYSLDLDPIEREDLCARSTYWSILDTVATSDVSLPETVDWARLRAGHLDAISADHWQFIEAPADRCGLADDALSLCLSGSFLEHVPDAESVIAESARILRPGGLAVHQIDYSDHRRWSGHAGPLELLCESSDEALVHNCNRLRHHEFVELFERAGFELRYTVIYDRTEIDDPLRSRLTGRFAAMSDDELSVIGATLFLRLRPA